MAAPYISLFTNLIQHFTTIVKDTIQFYFKKWQTQNANFRTMISDGQDIIIIGHYFNELKSGKKRIKGVFLPHKLINNIVYPIRPWFYPSFKGDKNGLSKPQAH